MAIRRIALCFTLGGLAFLVLTIPALSQTGPIVGSVVDSRSQPVANARVAVEGAGLQTQTNASGQFRLGEVQGPEVTLRVTRIGYTPLLEKVLVGRADLRLVLADAAIQLNAIVVTGTAGAVERRTVGNAISTVNVADLVRLASAPDITRLINGRATGVTVVPGTGVVGAGPRVNIRGQKSLSLSDQPLVYVDGVRVNNDISAGPKTQGFGSGVISRLGDFAPEDIESIEIIKGPAAATLYGTEASNGVIQIITKRGQVSRPTLDLAVRQGTTWFMNPQGRIPHNFGINPADGSLIELDYVKQESDRGTPIFTNGYLSGYNGNLSGGTELARYNFNAGYDRDNGIEWTNRVRRFTGRANVQATPSKNLDLSANLGTVRSDIYLANDIGNGALFNTLYGFPSTRDTFRRGFFRAPPDVLRRTIEQAQFLNRFTGSFQINYRATPWLSQRLVAGLDQTNERNQDFRPHLSPDDAKFYSPTAALGSRTVQFQGTTYHSIDYGATANLKLSGRLTSATSVGAQLYRRRTESATAIGQQFPASGLSAVSAAAVTFGSEDFVTNTTVGTYVQEQFGLNGRVYLTGAVRFDENSAFGKNRHLARYPKFSGTWVISEEPFWPLSFVNTLKLRGAYGQSGIQPDAFAALRTFQAVSAGGGAAVSPQFIGNPDLGPERSTEWEGGFETALLNERLTLDVTGYYTKTTDAILLRNQAPSLGFPGAQFVNIGALRNQGFEIQLNTTILNTSDVTWNLGFNISQNDNKILDLGGLGTTVALGGGGTTQAIVVPSLVDNPGIVLRHQVGLPAGSWFGKKIISATLDANGIAQNIKCDGGLPNSSMPGGPAVDCDVAPQLYLGRSDPRRQGAANAKVTLFKRLTLYGQVDFKLDVRHADNDTNIRCSLFFVCEANFRPEKYDPALIAEYQSGFIGSFVAANAAFAKLREVSASLVLPTSWAHRIGARSASISVAGRNLHTWTSFTSLDPETLWIGAGASRFTFDKTVQAFVPQLASVTATMNLRF
ncbi:MAG: TonB-dependent receptor [Gemmatimonadetes bacterium]|nr:TonB-dependent receptor [Gemmatimonadota bacterium]